MELLQSNDDSTESCQPRVTGGCTDPDIRSNDIVLQLEHTLYTETTNHSNEPNVTKNSKEGKKSITESDQQHAITSHSSPGRQVHVPDIARFEPLAPSATFANFQQLHCNLFDEMDVNTSTADEIDISTSTTDEIDINTSTADSDNIEISRSDTPTSISSTPANNTRVVISDDDGTPAQQKDLPMLTFPFFLSSVDANQVTNGMMKTIIRENNMHTIQEQEVGGVVSICQADLARYKQDDFLNDALIDFYVQW